MCSCTVLQVVWFSLQSATFQARCFGGGTILCVVVCGSEVLVERCISFGCVVEFSNGRCVYIVLTGPVGPTLCCSASGTWLGVWFLEEALTFALIYTLMITVCHTLSRCLLHVCVMLSGFLMEGLDFFKGVRVCGPPPKHRAGNIADWRENHTTYNTVQLHIQFRAPDDGQWWPETCRAFISIKIVNLSHLVGHIYHLYI
jgi:hypothetical protein